MTVHADGAAVRARRVIVALPPTLTSRIAYDPPLPGHRDQLTQRMPQGSVIKCMAIYDKPFWRERGLSGQATSDTGPGEDRVRQLASDGSPGVLLGFLEGERARAIGRLPAEERRAAVLAGLARLFGARPSKPDPLRRAQLGRGGVDPRLLRLLHAARRLDQLRRRPEGPDRPDPLGLRRDRTVWNGYMDGAVQSGERAAREALA